MGLKTITHPFAPVYDENSRILIVGSFPSVISREQQFYYANPRNRFYRVLAELLEEPVPHHPEEMRHFLLKNHIAVFDALASCSIRGSSDASIRDAVPNDFSKIFASAPVRTVYANGRAAHTAYEKHIGPAVYLPSTSPANAAYDLERLKEAWSVILPDLLQDTSRPRRRRRINS